MLYSLLAPSKEARKAEAKVRHGACRPFTRVVALFTPEFQLDGKATWAYRNARNLRENNK